MSTPQSLRKVRWRTVIPLGGGAVAVALSAVALQTRYSLLSQEARRGTWVSVLTAAWWLQQAFYWLVVAGAAVWLIGLVRRLAGRSSDSATTAVKGPRPLLGWWLASVITLVLLELTGAADLWLAEQPAAAPEHLLPPPAKQFRIAAIGGSSTAGFPYGPEHAFPALVGRRLARLFPDREIVVDNLARRGFTLEAAYGNLNALDMRPNVLLIYSGHNEFLMRYRLDHTPDERFRFQPSLLAEALARRIRALRVRAGTVDNLQLRDVRRPLIDRPIVNARERTLRFRNFRRHLEATVRWCRRNGVLPVLIIPAVNETGFEPCRSYVPLDFGKEQQERLKRLLQQAVAASDVAPQVDAGKSSDDPKKGDWHLVRPPLAAEGMTAPEPIPRLREALEVCPTFAMTWFLLGRAYESAGQYRRAQQAYKQALENDGFPWHATPFSAVYREIAEAYDVPLLDAREVLRPLARNKLLDDSLFHDVLHPTLRAHLAIRDALINVFRAHDMPEPSNRWPAPDRRDPDRAEPLPPLDAELWARVCEQVAKAQLGVPPAHFEPAHRRRKAALYTQAAAELRAGVPIDDIHLPGVGLARTAH